MKAVLPQYDIQAPEIVHVGLCAVTDSIRAQVEIRNCRFEWVILFQEADPWEYVMRKSIGTRVALVLEGKEGPVSTYEILPQEVTITLFQFSIQSALGNIYKYWS